MALSQSDSANALAARPLVVALVAVEPSGDLQAGALAEEIRRQLPGVVLVGIGGEHMAAAGVQLWMETQGLGTIGPGEVLARLPFILRSYWQVRGLLLAERPDLTILIDSPALNMRLAGVMQKRGLNCVYYFPPSAWTNNAARLRQIHARVRAVFCAFSLNAERYRRLDLPVYFFGHPIADMPELKLTYAQARQQLGVQGPVLAVLPGSREQEVNNLMPVFAETLQRLKVRFPELTVLIPCATAAMRRRIEAMVPSLAYVHLFDGSSRLVLTAADAALTASGTASLEAAAIGVPMVICYRFGPIDAFIGRFLVSVGLLRLEHVGLPSLIVNRRIVPELLQEQVTADNLTPMMSDLLADTPVRRQMLADLAEVKASLGQAGVVPQLAAAACKLVQESRVAALTEKIDIIITTNSPGELHSWVKGTAAKLRQQHPGLRLVLALVPCPYASGAEARVACQISELDIVLKPRQTLHLLLRGSVPGVYQPSRRGVAVYLGGDHWHAAALAKRLHYPAVGYAVRGSAFLRSFTAIGAMSQTVTEKLQADGFTNVVTVGNLSTDGVVEQVKALRSQLCPEHPLTLGLFPGSRTLHLRAALGVFLRVTQLVAEQLPQVHFLMAVSPFVTDEGLANALAKPLQVGLPTASGQVVGEAIVLDNGLRVELVRNKPYEAMARIDAALTIPGTNTGELAVCGMPMVVCLSAEAPIPRGGLGGVVDLLPWCILLKRYLRMRSYQRHGFAAQPNRLAKRMIVPEVIVKDDLKVFVEPIVSLLSSESERKAMANELRREMDDGQGASERMAKLILEQVKG